MKKRQPPCMASDAARYSSEVGAQLRREALTRRQTSALCVAVAGLLTALLLAAPGTSPAAVARQEQTVCTFPPPGAQWLPESCLHGPIEYLREYPDVRLATPAQRAVARSLHDQLVAAAKEENWRDLRAAADLGYRMHVGPRKPGDRKVHYFHAGSSPSQARKYGVLNARRPKALIYANAPGRPLVLVGAMWTMPPGARGPTPGGQFTRWHFHLACHAGNSMADMPGHNPNDIHNLIKAPASASCPAGTHLHIGRVEMMHIWFTHDLRSAFGARPPVPELCAAALIPRSYC
jgi:hypothetical protein